jgi:hypothetical protein
MPPRPRIDGVDLPSHRVGRPRQHSERRATQSISGPLFKGRPRHLLPDSFYVVGDAANATRKRVVTLCVAGVVCVCVCSVCALVLLTYLLLTFERQLDFLESLDFLLSSVAVDLPATAGRTSPAETTSGL